MTEFVQVRCSATQREAEHLALVLAAVGIGCRLVAGPGGVGLCVASRDAEAAREQLDAYERENAPERKPAMDAQRGLHGLSAATASALVLLFFFGAERRGAWSIDWMAVGSAQAGLIRDGAWWRTVTALTLHADHGHLLGNLVAGVIFGLLVAQILGTGLAWLAILLAGALGNAINALLQPPGHTAVGASTALFGALGILSGYMRRRRILPWRGGIRRWAPLAAGVMLLVYLGFGGERTDVGAHVAGFAVGGVLGLALAHFSVHIRQGPRAQWLYEILTCSLVSLAWLLALRGAG